MTEREQKNAFATYNRRLEQYGKNLGTNSRQYQHLLRIGETAGFTFGAKGDYVTASVGRSELQKMNEDVLKVIKSIPTWGKTKQWYTERLDLKGKSRKEQKAEIRAESEFTSNLENTMNEIYNMVYEWEREHATIDSEYIITEYHDNVSDAWHYTREQFSEWVQKIKEEMARGGEERKRTYNEMSGDIYNDLYGAEI